MTEFHPRDFRRGLRHAGLSDSEFRVAVELCEYSSVSKPLVWPSQVNLAKTCGVAERSLRRILRRLEEKGVVSCAAPSKGGRGQTTRWLLSVKTLTDESGFSDPKPGPRSQGLRTETMTRGAQEPGPASPETLTGGSGEVVRSRDEEGGARASAARQPASDPTGASRRRDRAAGWVVGPHGPRCLKHIDHPDPPNCQGCRAGREAVEADQQLQQQHRADEQMRKRRQVAACPDCDEAGWLLAGDRTPVEPAQKCSHRRAS
ncbi:helix-turn-helix domain-containing protein [Mycolicibacterium arseniciresistens]|uniref:helix-turn-helix domain-containing protein n=1 Tax=Mycolicibacterium arseniciresistens TaxID=3062257 RepID=UPI003899357A